jgi:hypothetical protein
MQRRISEEEKFVYHNKISFKSSLFASFNAEENFALGRKHEKA